MRESSADLMLTRALSACGGMFIGKKPLGVEVETLCHEVNAQSPAVVASHWCVTMTIRN